jgi:hypothetical protein
VEANNLEHLESEPWDSGRSSGKRKVILKEKAKGRSYPFHIFVSGPIDLDALYFFL